MLSLLNLRHNIIAQAEFRYQRYVLDNSRSGLGWILLAVGLMLPAMLFSLGAFLLALFGVSLDDWAIFQSGILLAIANIFFTANLIMNIALYVVLMMIAVGLAYNSITREKSRRTWDVLLLTNVDSEKMVWGKWWASLMALWGDHLMLVVLRVGLACGILVQPLRGEANPALVLLVVAIITVFTLLDVAFTVALGIASALSGVPTSISGGIVFIVRAIVIAFAGGVYALMLFYLASDHISPFLILSGVLIVALAALTWVALLVAQYAAVHGDLVSPVQRSSSTAPTTETSPAPTLAGESPQ